MRHKTRIPSSMKNLRGLCGDPVKVEDRPACPACPLLLLLPRRLLPRLFCAHIREFINKSQIGFVTSPGLRMRFVFLRRNTSWSLIRFRFGAK